MILTGEHVHAIQFTHTTEMGLPVNNIPVNTELLPVLLFSRSGKPRWFFALVGSILTSVLVPDKAEQLLMEWGRKPLIVARQ
jgi:hypothetical protein